ncbi:MAG: hypothetical protein BGN88_05715 [Clostridiales bacterium 43-6]|nr:MAG: hypothetical protein BGN88_05715 [Clostridiales bacterium 43-6]
MKKLISVLALICVISILFTSCVGEIKSKNPHDKSNLVGPGTTVGDLYATDMTYYEKIAAKGNYELWFNKSTTDIFVKVLDTGYIWSSAGNYMNSTPSMGKLLTMSYSNLQGTNVDLSSDTDSVAKGQFKYELIKDKDVGQGVKIQYSLGDVQLELFLPLAMSPERFKMFTAKMSEDDKAIMEHAYFLVDFNSDEYAGRAPEEIAEYKNNYKLAGETPWYYTRPDIVQETKLAVDKALKAAGYTDADFVKDNKGTNYKKTETPEFNVNLYLTLDQDGLNVRIPENEIYHSKNNTIENICVLPDFAATSKIQRETGYFLLPDGSGSIMNFYNGKDDYREDHVYVPIYGVDKSLNAPEKTEDYNQAIFPVFGVSVDSPSGKNNGILAIIEEGETFAGIEARTGTGGDSLTAGPAIWPEFRINEKARIKSFTTSQESNENFNIFQFERYLGNLRVKYKFLSGDSSYSAMAKKYQKYLFGDRQPNAPKPYTSTVEMVNVIDVKKNFLGVTYNSKETLTTFDQAEKIALELKNAGLQSINLKLSGWFGGGYRHGLLNSIKVEKGAGGTDRLKSVYQNLTKNGINVFMDADVQYAYSNALTFGKPNNRDIASYINKQTGIYMDYNPVTFRAGYTSPSYMLTQDAVSKNFKGLMSGYEKLGIKNVSLRHIGEDILANYTIKTYAERQTVLNKLLDNVKELDKKGYKIMGSTGDAPFVQYLDVINGLPIESADHDKTDYSVPFTAMVLSGYVDYTYKPINLSNSEPADLLKLVETGAGASFILTGQHYTKLSSSEFHYLYSTEYADIKDNVVTAFKKLEAAQKNTYGSVIAKHERLAEKVYKTTYTNGYYAVVNYTDKDYQYTNEQNTVVKVKAKDFITGKGGAANGN